MKHCSQCNNAIDAQFVTVDNQDYHPECFACAKCSTPISGRFVRLNGKITCENCAKGIPNVSGESCAVCNRALDGPFQQKSWGKIHAQCFKCEICSKELGGLRYYKVGNDRGVCTRPCLIEYERRSGGTKFSDQPASAFGDLHPAQTPNY